MSSTLGELAAERAVAREAIERLRLTPVMFELGARPHPPRELYRAYLDQSHVFVGIYWQRYGWIAPGESVSGLEDEYRLAGDRPRLLYLKEPSPEREPRLDELLSRFQDDDLASYKRFTDLDELASLLEDDLAVLLSERFEAAGSVGATVDGHRPAPAAAPLLLTRTIGRTSDIDAIVGALREGRRLVTLTGSGGIGKTRIAVEVAHALEAELPGPVLFVPLAATHDVDQALRTILDRLDTHVEAASPVEAL